LTTISQPVNEIVPMRRRVAGILMTMLGAALFALMPIAVRAIEGYVAPSIVFFRALSGALTLTVVVLAMPAQRPHLNPRRLERKTVLSLIGLGATFCGSSVFYFISITHTSVAKAVLLNYTAPLYVALLGPLLLKEHSSRVAKLALLIGFAGIVLIAEPANLTRIGSDETIGVISGLISGLCFSGIFLFGRLLAGRVPPLIRTIWSGAVVALLMLPWGISAPAPPFWHNLPWMVMLGTVSMALPLTLFFKAQEHISAQTSSTVALFEPVCGVIIGYLVFGESLSPAGILGAAAILISIYLASR
jgi:drug/metabolite transporter (DMT)-like permease